MPGSLPRIAVTCRAPALVVMLAVAGCHPVVLKTVDLRPVDLKTGTSGFAGSQGVCFSAGHPPPTTFAPGAGQVMVGFDNFFRPGSQPFPCDDLRVSDFRGGVRFDVSAFDSPVAATLLFDTARSVSRSDGRTTTSPPTSFATTLSLATEPFTFRMRADDDASLPAGGNISIVVGSQVRDWATNARPNFGFVIWGPHDPPDRSAPANDNDARVSWYQNFILRVIYNPALNPRAPQ